MEYTAAYQTRSLSSCNTTIDTAHAQSIIHGDLKPSNLFLAYSKDLHEPSLKVLDFGLARLAPVPQNSGPATSAFPDTDRETASGHIQGTPSYMAPELLEGCNATPASDRFAFGVVTYELLTGSPPFGSHLWQVREKLQNSPPTPSCRNPQLPVELDAPVLALLKRAPEQRPTSASAAVSAGH
jgi:serine/threonine protein kinase